MLRFIAILLALIPTIALAAPERCGQPALTGDAALAQAVEEAMADDLSWAEANNLPAGAEGFASRAAERIKAFGHEHPSQMLEIARHYYFALCQALTVRGLGQEALDTVLPLLAQAFAAHGLDASAFETQTASDQKTSQQETAEEGATPPREKAASETAKSEERAPALAAAGNPAPDAQMAAAEPPAAHAPEPAPAPPVAGSPAPPPPIMETAPSSAPPAPAQQTENETAAEKPAKGDVEPAMPAPKAESSDARPAEPPAAPIVEPARRPEPTAAEAPSAPAPASPAPAPQPAETVSEECQALGIQENCTDYSAYIARLKGKPLEYNHPRVMYVGRKTEISLVLRADWKGKDMPAEAAPEMQGLEGDIKQSVSKVTQVMSARLIGADFEVEPEGQQERLVTTSAPVVWNWLVTPTETGSAKRLKLELFAHIRAEGEMKPPALIKTLDASIDVDVKTWDWIISQARAIEPIYGIMATLIGIMTAAFTFLYRRWLPASPSEAAAEQIARTETERDASDARGASAASWAGAVTPAKGSSLAHKPWLPLPKTDKEAS